MHCILKSFALAKVFRFKNDFVLYCIVLYSIAFGRLNSTLRGRT